MQQKENIREITHGLSWDFGFIHAQSAANSYPGHATNVLIRCDRFDRYPRGTSRLSSLRTIRML
jgi:hypothetical protein